MASQEGHNGLTDSDRLLIVKTSSIGDVAHALPIAQIIKQHAPEVSIGWVVRSRCAALVQGNPWIDRVHVIPDRPSMRELALVRRQLRAERYTIALDMQGLLLSGIIARMSGARRRVGLDLNREGNRRFLTEPVVPARRDRNRHAIDILRDFLPPIGIDRDAHWPVLDYLGASADASDGSGMQPIGRGTIALNVGASSVYKQWPTERWAALARRLVDEGWHCILLGGPGDVHAAAAVRAEIGLGSRIEDRSGRTSLSSLAALLRECDLLISADTGPLHIAVAVGTPTVALFGPTSPGRTGPYGERDIVIWKPPPCGPCFRRPTCGGRVDCMAAIEADEVFTAAMAAVGDRLVC